MEVVCFLSLKNHLYYPTGDREGGFAEKSNKFSGPAAPWTLAKTILNPLDGHGPPVTPATIPKTEILSRRRHFASEKRSRFPQAVPAPSKILDHRPGAPIMPSDPFLALGPALGLNLGPPLRWQGR